MASNKCKQCKHWCFHNKKNDPEPLNAISYYYCDAAPMMIFISPAKSRLAVCEFMKLFEEKE